MSYTIDVYRREIEPCRSLMDYATFVTFFPELIAGPIVRASIFLPQMTRRIGPTADRLAVGASLFLLGLTKKVVIADRLAAPVDQVFAQPALFSGRTLWLAVIGYSLQIYCDFSGYSDMAIGTAQDDRLRPAGELQHAVRRQEHHRVLAALAHDAERVAARLPLHPARRQPEGRAPHAT